MVPKFHDYERESEDFYDHIASRFDHSFDWFLSSFLKRFIIKHLKTLKIKNPKFFPLYFEKKKKKKKKKKKLK